MGNSVMGAAPFRLLETASQSGLGTNTVSPLQGGCLAYLSTSKSMPGDRSTVHELQASDHARLSLNDTVLHFRSLCQLHSTITPLQVLYKLHDPVRGVVAVLHAALCKAPRKAPCFGDYQFMHVWYILRASLF